jgi:hypothetical protein
MEWPIDPEWYLGSARMHPTVRGQSRGHATFVEEGTQRRSIFWEQTMSLDLSPSEQLAYTTVRIECDTPGGRSTGTGFYFQFCEHDGRHVPAIVTNRHVVRESTMGRFHVHLSPSQDTAPTGQTCVGIRDFEKAWIGHPDPDVDLCVMPIGPLIGPSKQQEKQLFYRMMSSELLPSRQVLSELTAIEEIVMVGYPNGIWDHVNNMPLFRRGVTATHPNIDYCGKKEFMIDAACFPGSSGSPVLLYNFGSYSSRGGGLHLGTRMKLLGVLYAGPQHTATGEIVIADIPTVAKPTAISRIPNNLGIVIKAERLREFVPVLEKLISDTSGPLSPGAHA